MNDLVGNTLALRRHPSPLRRLMLLGLAWATLASPLSGRERRLIALFYLTAEPPSFQSLQENYQHISVVSPQWFSVNPQAQLESTLDSSVEAWAIAHGVRLMPLVANQNFQPEAAHTALADGEIQSSLVARLAETASTHHFYGLQIDFENIPANDRDRYSAFIARLAREFRRRRLKLSVAVVAPLSPAPTSSTAARAASSTWITNEHSLAFDYRKLSKEADFISLMTYDEYASPEQPGPVAGHSWVEACLRKVLELVPSKKVLLGIPLYYRHWAGKSVSEGSYSDALNLASRAGVQAGMDPEQRESRFKFEDGRQTHVVWLQDALTLQQRIALAREYRLAGFSAWRLGFEDPVAWKDAFPATPLKVR